MRYLGLRWPSGVSYSTNYQNIDFWSTAIFAWKYPHKTNPSPQSRSINILVAEHTYWIGFSTEISIQTSIVLLEQNEFGFSDYRYFGLKKLTGWFLETSKSWAPAGPQPVCLLIIQANRPCGPPACAPAKFLGNSRYTGWGPTQWYCSDKIA